MSDKFLIKLNRFCVWILLIIIVVYIVSGFGMVKGIIDRVFARQIHTKILPIPLFIIFILHVGIGIRYVLRRWNIFRNTKTADIYTIIFGLILLILFLWLYLV